MGLMNVWNDIYLCLVLDSLLCKLAYSSQLVVMIPTLLKPTSNMSSAIPNTFANSPNISYTFLWHMSPAALYQMPAFYTSIFITGMWMLLSMMTTHPILGYDTWILHIFELYLHLLSEFFTCFCVSFLLQAWMEIALFIIIVISDH